ncbi:hypothetical protein [Flavobacterium sp.]|uniref:hypothetical protein n=1 Tax=Flavobacterium sp. TaxID=239 RepID=UPI003D6B5AF6
MNIREEFIKENGYSYFNNTVLNEYAIWLEKKITETNQALQLQQTGVKQSVCKNCGKPFIMHSRASGMCQDRFKHFE